MRFSNAARALVAKAGVFVGARRRINFIDGTGISTTITDDPASDEIDVTIATSSTAPVIRSKRTATGTIGGTASADVSVTWPSNFSNTNYTVTASIEQDIDTGLRILRVRSKTTSGCVVRVTNDSVTGQSGTVHTIGVAD